MSIKDKPYLYEPDPREDRLPVWARELVLSLRREARKLQAALDATKGDYPDSNVKLVGGPNQLNVALPKNSHVAVTTGWGHIRVGHDLDGMLRIQGDGSILVRPNAGNCLVIELEG